MSVSAGGQASAAATIPSTPTGAPLPFYDVSSVKVNHSASSSWGEDSDRQRFSGVNLSFLTLLEQAYGIRANLISGVPPALAAARFDIEAKVVDPDPEELKKLTPEQERAMLQPMLTERFKLAVHTVTRTLSVFNLTLQSGQVRFKVADPAGPKTAQITIHSRDLTARSITMAEFAESLGGVLQRTVVDTTGLSGRYNLGLNWSAEEMPDPAPDAPPTLFTALKEQLGLRLQPGKGPVVTLVVDHVEMPSEN